MSGANVRIIPVSPKIIEQAVIAVFVFMILPFVHRTNLCRSPGKPYCLPIQLWGNIGIGFKEATEVMFVFIS